MKTNAFLLIAIIILIILFLKQCQVAKELKIDQQVAEGNLEALRDTVKTERNKAGEIEFTKQLLISKSEDLEKWNKELAAQYLFNKF